MFARFRIEFFNFELSCHGALVFVSCVEVASTCTGNQFDLLSHAFTPVALVR